MTIEQSLKLLENLLRVTLVVAVAVAAADGSWFNLFIAAVALVLTFLPDLVEKTYRIEIPMDFEFATIVFVYASLFLGEIDQFYERFWWWDIMLHASSAVAIACIGFAILYVLLHAHRIAGEPFWIAGMSFCFSLAIGALWEIFEFSMDQALGTNMQKSGLADTMGDLIFDGLGAMTAALAGYAYMKGDRRSYLARLFRRFFKSNPQLKS